MKEKAVKKLANEEFHRLTGVKKETYEKMKEVLEEAHAIKKARGGRKNKLNIGDMLLMTLEYLREYRTYFHIGNNYRVSESYAYKIIRWVENTLIKSKVFSLPGRKALLKSDVKYEVVLVDASEPPVHRPKKSKGTITQERRKGIRLKHK